MDVTTHKDTIVYDQKAYVILTCIHVYKCLFQQVPPVIQTHVSMTKKHITIIKMQISITKKHI